MPFGSFQHRDTKKPWSESRYLPTNNMEGNSQMGNEEGSQASVQLCMDSKVQARGKIAKAERCTASDLYDLLISQDMRCALSGVKLKPSTAALDHKQPVSRGGKHHINDLQWIYRKVNAAKATMDNDEFIAMCKRIAAHFSQGPSTP